MTEVAPTTAAATRPTNKLTGSTCTGRREGKVPRSAEPTERVVSCCNPAKMPNVPNMSAQNSKKSAFRSGPSARAAITRMRYPTPQR